MEQKKADKLSRSFGDTPDFPTIKNTHLDRQSSSNYFRILACSRLYLTRADYDDNAGVEELRKAYFLRYIVQ